MSMYSEDLLCQLRNMTEVILNFTVTRVNIVYLYNSSVIKFHSFILKSWNAFNVSRDKNRT